MKRSDYKNYSSVVARFLLKVKPTNKKRCWKWVGAKYKKGYGYFRIGGKQVKGSMEMEISL